MYRELTQERAQGVLESCNDEAQQGSEPKVRD